ncbi:MAG TPA: DUF4157 domain-containing protein [Allosphingosinicella sp.]|nr:DUF4157 domain-containing protein [Allosphingosinicella sp.]
MGKQRKLTAGEIALAEAAFGTKIDYKRVKLADGPGNSFAAHIAFARGNPAITLGSTVYFKHEFCDDFSRKGQNRKSYMHEMTHVWQYQKLGMAVFLLRYADELVMAGGKPNDMYKYDVGKTLFNEAMLEAQADMVGDYSEALWASNASRKALLAKNMAGSGIYAF